jgi:hypothetical protein
LSCAAGLNFATAHTFYAAAARHTFNPQAENTILEQMFFALHQLAALNAFRAVPRRADVARMGIVAWYDGVYYAGSGMVAAQDGSFQDDHADTTKSCDRHFAERRLAMPTFGLRVTTLIEKSIKAEVVALRAGNHHDLRTVASTPADALGACCAYLSGTANWYRWRTTEDLRQAKEFKALGVSDFRKKAAQQVRDQRLGRGWLWRSTWQIAPPSAGGGWRIVKASNRRSSARSFACRTLDLDAVSTNRQRPRQCVQKSRLVVRNSYPTEGAGHRMKTPDCPGDCRASKVQYRGSMLLTEGTPG